MPSCSSLQRVIDRRAPCSTPVSLKLLDRRGRRDVRSSGNDFCRLCCGIIMEPMLETSWKNRKKVSRKRQSRPSSKITASKKSIVETLPMDLLTEVVTSVVSTSQSPINDLKNLKRTCKNLYRCSKDKLVGRQLALENEVHLRWRDGEQYHAFLCACADADNVEANYVLGMEEIYIMGKALADLQHLKKAAEGGHSAAAYAMGIFLLRDPSTQHLGVEILDDLVIKGGSTEETGFGESLIHRCRRKSLSTLRELWINAKPGGRGKQDCVRETCGRVKKRKAAGAAEDCCWVPVDMLGREFCSSLCRWNWEYDIFVSLL